MKRYLWPDHPDFVWKQQDRDALIVLLTSTVLLLVFFYWGRPGFYFSSGLSGYVSDFASGSLEDFPGVGAYLWWGFTSMVLRFGVPLAIVIWVLRKSPGDFGFRIRGTAKHLPMYGAMYLVMLPVLIWVSGFESFLNYYPFYSRAVEGGAGFWLYEMGYGLQFAGVEAFFRGFMTFGLLPRFGALSVVMMTVPYTMIHFSKPMPEATAAIVAGLVLGTMAVKSRSFVPGILLHVSVAITMDLLVLSRLGVIGNIF
ncbi:MAG: CPBP family intramembrane metalloprotease [bacterium]|nr:CPBP family intramembrane metalloprotease [bacterium]